MQQCTLLLFLLAEKGSSATAKEKLKKGDVIYSVNNELITSAIAELLKNVRKELQ